MGISTVQIVLLVIFGCIAGMGSVLDSFQTHRPLIACTVVGLILGDVKTGILLGGTLEMIALGWMNIGAAQSPDSALASSKWYRDRTSSCSCRSGVNSICSYSNNLLPARS